MLQAQYAKWRAERALTVPVEDPDGQDLALPSVADREGRIATYEAVTGKPSAAALATLSPGTIVVAALGEALLPDNSAASWRATLSAVERSATFQKVDAGPQASRPAAGTFGIGIYVETDSRRVFYSNGTLWIEYGVPRLDNASQPTPGATTTGMLVADTDLEELRLVTATERILVRPLPPHAQKGATLTWTSSTGMTMSAGLVRDSADAMNLEIASMAKVLNAAGTWTAEGKYQVGERNGDLKFEISESKDADALVSLKLNIDHKLAPLKETDPRLQTEPIGSGGLMMALYQWHRFLTVGPTGFEGLFAHGGHEPFYPYPADGSAPKSLASLRTDCAVIRTKHGSTEAKWYFSLKDHTLLGFETFITKDEDPCEVYFGDYKAVDGRQLPHRIEIRYKDKRYAVLTISKYTLGKK